MLFMIREFMRRKYILLYNFFKLQLISTSKIWKRLKQTFLQNTSHILHTLRCNRISFIFASFTAKKRIEGPLCPCSCRSLGRWNVRRAIFSKSYGKWKDDREKTKERENYAHLSPMLSGIGSENKATLCVTNQRMSDGSSIRRPSNPIVSVFQPTESKFLLR